MRPRLHYYPVEMIAFKEERMMSTAELLIRSSELEAALREIEAKVQPEKNCLVCAAGDVPCAVCAERARISGLVAAIRKRVLP